MPIITDDLGLPENPYPKELRTHILQTRVSDEDYWYLKQLFPVPAGLVDRVLGQLFHNLIQNIKTHGLDPAKPEHSAWHRGHPSIATLKSCLERASTAAPIASLAGPPARRPSRRASRRDGTGGVSSVREALHEPTGLGSDNESDTGQGKRKAPRGRKEKVEKEFGGPSDGTTQPTSGG